MYCRTGLRSNGSERNRCVIVPSAEEQGGDIEADDRRREQTDSTEYGIPAANAVGHRQDFVFGESVRQAEIAATCRTAP